MIKWEPTQVQGSGVLHYDRHPDERGYFNEIYNRKDSIKAMCPFPWAWPQENVSASRPGVLRGFHLQRNNPQGKLVTCLVGRIVDVCLDLRTSSPTFMKMTQVILDENYPASFYLTPGTAHAFFAMRESMIHYKCTTEYDQASDGGVNPFSPEIAHAWNGLGLDQGVIQSAKDMSLPLLMDYLNSRG